MNELIAPTTIASKTLANKAIASKALASKARDAGGGGSAVGSAGGGGSAVGRLVLVIGITLVCSLLLLSTPYTEKAQAAESSGSQRLKRSNNCNIADANNFVDKKAQELLKQMQKQQAEQKAKKYEPNSQQARERKTKYQKTYKNILKEVFAHEAVARSLVGPYWRKMSASQQASYKKLIGEILQITISNNIYNLQVENYSIEEASRLGKDFAVRLLVKLENEAEPVPVVWRVRCFQSSQQQSEQQTQENKNMGIVDLLFRNISVIAGKRAEMTALLSKRGVAEFLKLLDMERQRLIAK